MNPLKKIKLKFNNVYLKLVKTIYLKEIHFKQGFFWESISISRKKKKSLLNKFYFIITKKYKPLPASLVFTSSPAPFLIKITSPKTNQTLSKKTEFN